MSYLFSLFIIALSCSLATCSTPDRGVRPPPEDDGVIHVYDRKEWGDWLDINKDCKNTRAEVLIRDSLQKVIFRKGGCTVDAGKWNDFYSGETINLAGQIDIDHVVPVKHAFESGGKFWVSGRRREFYNDPENLVVTSKHNNRSKGANDFTNWHPIERARACVYAQKWFKIKKKYELFVSPAEIESLKLLKCE